MNRAFSRSLLLHSIFAILIYFLVFRNPPPPIQTELIVTDSFGDKNKIEKRRPPRTGILARSARKAEGVTLSDLGMQFNPLEYVAPNSRSSPESFYTGPSTVNDDSGWDLLNPDPRIARFNQYLYNTVQGWLDRESYLITGTLTGTVKIKMWFDAEGNYLENETVYDAIDPDFKRIVQISLHNSFLRPIPKPYLFTNKKFSIQRQVVLRKY
ncbi:MAG: hypothetical protein JST80_06275 [Bdellovibrionales bacterium]|nr:hypothetical protein [Bdellovibrionales bacterium]